METAIVHLETVARVETRDHSDQPVTQVDTMMMVVAEVKFVHPVSPGGSVKFVASDVNFSTFTNFLCFFLLKLLELGEIDGVKYLT